MAANKKRKRARSIAAPLLADVFSECANTISWRYDAFLAEPQDPETLHKLRVSLRTARSLVSFCAPWIKAKQLDDLDEAMRKVVKKTSLLRELDVLAQQAREISPDDGRLHLLCQTATAEERERVGERLAGKKARKRLTFACDELHRIAWKKSAYEGLDEKAVRLRFGELFKASASRIAQLDYSDYAQVHEARKGVKQLRYAAESFKELLSDKAAASAADSKSEQDRLGAICDAYASLQLVDKLGQRPDGAGVEGLERLAEHYRGVVGSAQR